MTKIFENKFFSAAGQKERLSNVGATIKASLTGKGVTANTGSKVVDKVLGAAASNPYTTAAIVAVAAAPKVAGAAVKESIAGLKPAQKVALGLATPPAVAVIVSNPKGSAKAIAETPSNLSSFGSNFYETIKNPSKENLMSIYKDNPVIAGVATTAAAFVLGKGVQAAYYGSEILGNKEVKETIIKESAAVPITQDAIVPTKPLEPQLVNVSRSVSNAKRRTKSSKSTPIFSPSLRVNIYNQTKSTKYIKMLAY